MIELRCVGEHIAYRNPDNGWSVMKVKVKGYDNLLTLPGSLLDVHSGSVLLVDCDWKVDARYCQRDKIMQIRNGFIARLKEINTKIEIK